MQESASSEPFAGEPFGVTLERVDRFISGFELDEA